MAITIGQFTWSGAATMVKAPAAGMLKAVIARRSGGLFGRHELVLDRLFDRDFLLAGANGRSVERKFRVGSDKGVELLVGYRRRAAHQRIAAVMQRDVDGLAESRSLGRRLVASRHRVEGLDGLIADLDGRSRTRSRGGDHVVGHRVAGQERRRDVAGRGELRSADRVELEPAVSRERPSPSRACSAGQWRAPDWRPTSAP